MKFYKQFIIVIIFSCAYSLLASKAGPSQPTFLNASGKPVENAEQATCVIDATGYLLWELKSNQQPSTRYMGNLYSWFNPNLPKAQQGVSNGFESKFCNWLTRCNTHRYIEETNAKKLCGHQNWHLPTPKELKSLIRHRATDPLIDTTIFPHTASGNYWSSALGKDDKNAIDVPFFGGSLSGETEKLFGGYVRLVHDLPAK